MSADGIDALRLILYAWAGVVAPVIAWLIAQWRRLGVRHEALARDMVELRGQIERSTGRMDGDVRSLRDRLNQAPTAAGLATVEGEIKAIRAALDGMSRFMSRMDAVLSRQEEHLLRSAPSGGGQ